MYVATRELKVIPVGTNKTILYKAGDVVKDFEDWDIHSRRAHLNLNWIEKVEAAEEAPPQKIAAKKGKKKAHAKLKK